jgi:glutamyl/glutaminyl-tRNA synthetase
MMAVRALVTGEAQTPPIDAVLALVGRERTLDRLRLGLAG